LQSKLCTLANKKPPDKSGGFVPGTGLSVMIH